MSDSAIVQCVDSVQRESVGVMAKSAKTIAASRRPQSASMKLTLGSCRSFNEQTFAISKPHNILTMFLWPIISGLLFSNAQYSAPLLAPLSGSTSGFCDSSRLLKCQQDVAKDLQLSSFSAASVQYPISQGPPYSPAAKLREQQQRTTSLATCRLVRANLDCMLLTTPACYESGLASATQTSDLALRAKRFLEQYNCNEPESTWQTTFCYRSPEIRACEDKYGFVAFNTAPMINATTCLTYSAYKYCVEAHLRFNCKVQEMDMANEYLIDRAGDLAWRCPANSSLLYGQAQSNPYGMSNGIGGKLLSPQPYDMGSYEQRPLPNYLGQSQTNGVSLVSKTYRDRAWQHLNPNIYEDTRLGISRLPDGSGTVFDRITASEPGYGSEICASGVAPSVREECESALMEQQILARDARDGFELQRRICCSLHQLKDCISRIVSAKCKLLSITTSVDILMGQRRRELDMTCPTLVRDLCSGALPSAALSPILLVIASLFASYFTFKPQQAL